MWELDYQESWVPKNWCLWTVVLEKTLESPLDCKEIQPVHPKENQSWIFIWKPDSEAEAPILWPPNAKNWLIGRDPDAGKDWRQMEKSVTADWGDWMASLNQWTWIGANSRRWRWWKTGNPDMLKSMGSQRVRHDLATEQQQQDVILPTLRTGMHRIALSKEIFFMSFLWPIDISALCKRLWAMWALITVSIVSLHCLLRMYHLLYLGSLAETSISIFFHLYSKT